MIDLIYEDNHQLVLNKPHGLLTQPSGTDRMSLECLAKQWIKDKYQKPGNVYLHAVHRLDKPVSGLVLFAKTSKALSRLQAAFRAKQCRKVYHASVEGSVDLDEATLEHYLLYEDHQAEIVSSSTPGAKLCRLHYKVLERNQNHTLLEIELETGRTHQIRAQMAATGHPILGDQKYGSLIAHPGITLTHVQLQIAHPITGDMQQFSLNNKIVK